MKNSITLEKINSSISIVDLISETYELNGRGNRLTAKDHPSLTVYADSNTWYWFSQDKGSSVIDWYAHIHSCDTRTAIGELRKQLGGGDFTPRPKPAKATQPQVPAVEKWQSERWQANTRRMIDQSQERLHFAPEGARGRDYLLSRGIKRDIWLAYELGYAVVNNPNVEQKMESIVMPWQREKITALEFRFLTSDKGARFSCWGKRYLFGLNRLSCKGMRSDNVRQSTSNTILFIEGPLNAISVYQESYNELGLDVVSFGSQGSIKKSATAAIIQAIAKNYKHLLVWADEAQVALAALDIMPNAYLIKSPDGNDANDILQAGYLTEFLYTVLKKQSIEV